MENITDDLDLLQQHPKIKIQLKTTNNEELRFKQIILDI